MHRTVHENTVAADQAQVVLRSGEALGSELATILRDHRQTRSPREVHNGYKLAAVLILKINGGWTYEQIGQFLDHPKGHVQRIFEYAVERVRELMGVNPRLGTEAEREGLDEEVDPLPTAADDREMTLKFASLNYDTKRRALQAVLDGGDTGSC